MRKVWICTALCACLVCLCALALAEQIERDGLLYAREGGQMFAVEYVQGADEIVIHSDIEGFPISYERLGYAEKPTPRLVLAEGTETVSGWQFSTFNARTLVLPSSLREIGEDAFSGMRSLTELSIPEGVERIGERSFSSSALVMVSLPSTLVSIDDAAFLYCTELKSFSVHPDNPNYQAIDGVLYTKDGKTLLRFPSIHGTSWTVPDGTMEIDAKAFGHNAMLESLTLCEGIVELNESLFSECTALVELELPTTVRLLGDWTLPTTLKRLTVKEGSPYFREEANAVFQIADSALIFHWPGTDTVYSVPAGTRRIGPRAFLYDEALLSVSLPMGLLEIGDSAFGRCSALTGVAFPVTLERIGQYAFASCVSLERLSLPPGLRAIGNGAFSNCAAVKTVRIPASVAEMGDYAFEDNPQMTIVAEPGSAGATYARKGKPAVDPLGMPYREFHFAYDARPVIVNGSGTDDLLSLYKSPDAASDILGQYPNGTTAIVNGEEGEWLYVTVGYEDGYVKADGVMEIENLHTLYTPMEAEVSGGPVGMMDAPFEMEESVPLEGGERLYISATWGTWYQVMRASSSGNDMSGFVPTNAVTILRYDDAERGGQYAIVQNPSARDRLHLREAASTDSRSLGRFFNGTQVEVLGEQGDWYRVRVAGQEGYMMAKYLVKVYNQ